MHLSVIEVQNFKLTENTRKFPVFHVSRQNRITTDTEVVRKFQLTIILDNIELGVLSRSPSDQEYLTLGFIQSSGLIESKDEIKYFV